MPTAARHGRIDRGVAVALGLAAALFAIAGLLGSATLPGEAHQPRPDNCGTAFGALDKSGRTVCQERQQSRLAVVGLMLLVAIAIGAAAVTSAVSGWRGSPWPLPDAMLMVGLPLAAALSLVGFVYWASLAPSGD
ncbi:MAG: hypothetical protein ABI658_05835 [Acidimicrobiales bacterium]